jgi:hypothetical protein
MTEPALCRWCGCPVDSRDGVPTEDARHGYPMLCQALLLRKLVEHVTKPPVWIVPKYCHKCGSDLKDVFPIKNEQFNVIFRDSETEWFADQAKKDPKP